ncbi:hypothetical protein MTAT_30060 [Moorella thermoacetica]|uniref:Uncharacterized protein n=1 Tax=Neomoorella thermoacetica TaxID=1525 RepID=A0ABY3N1Y6_NEOTH|nr:hypothetical protein MTAT_30060 [Moorella thermoacetica]
MDHDAASDDGRVLPPAQGMGAPDLESIILIVNNRNSRAAKANIYRPLVGGGGKDGLPGFLAVGRDDDRHVGDGPHQGHVLDSLVGGAVFADGKAGVGGGDFYVDLRVGDAVADLVIGPAGGKNGESAGKGDLAA